MSIKIVRALHKNAMKDWGFSLSESEYYDLIVSAALLFAQVGMDHVTLFDIKKNAGISSFEKGVVTQLTLQQIYYEVLKFSNALSDSIVFSQLEVDSNNLMRIGCFSEGLTLLLSDYLPFVIIGFLGDFFNTDSHAKQQSQLFRQRWVQAIKILAGTFWQESQIQDVSQKSLTYLLGYLSRFVLNDPDTESIERFVDRLERYWLGFGLLDSVVNIEDSQEIPS